MKPLKAKIEKIEKIEETPAEFFANLEINVADELERILGVEIRSAILDTVREKEGWTDEQKLKILKYEFKGKTILDWEIAAKEAQGYAEDGNPAWYEPHTNMIDGFTLAKMLFLEEDQL